ncbi:MAG: hypothetical protein PHU25_21080 [Deltaproteobacteria bacterium]|nr:hypothetical protein [Deltaproteobacteria bacterium]
MRPAMLERALLPGLGAAAVVVVAVVFGRIFGLVPCDDAYITYQHARHFASGQGLVFNPGEPLEATTNFLFALLVGLLARFPLVPPPQGARLLTMAALFAVAFLVAQDGFARASKLGSRTTAVTGLVVLAAAPALLVHFNLGLETVFYSALVFGAVVAVLDPLSGPGRWAVCGLFLGLAAATRLDALLVAVALGVALLALRGPRAALVPLGALVAGLTVVVGPASLLRWTWYGALLPNTFYAKVGGGGPLLMFRGAEYLLGFLGAHSLYAAAAIAMVVRLRRAPGDRHRSAILLAALAPIAATALLVGGDYFPFFRFLVPTIPVFALVVTDVAQHGLAGTARIPAARPWLRARWLMPLAVLAMLAACGKSELRLLSTEGSWVRQQVRLGEVLALNLPRDAELLVAAAGAVPYYSRLVAHDQYGLTDPVLARSSGKRLGLGLPGHEKRGDWRQIERYRPDVVLYPSLAGRLPPRLAGLYVSMHVSAPKMHERTVLVRRDFVSRLGPAFRPMNVPRKGVRAETRLQGPCVSPRKT